MGFSPLSGFSIVSGFSAVFVVDFPPSVGFTLMPPSLHKSEVQIWQLHLSVTGWWPSKSGTVILQKSLLKVQPYAVAARESIF
jgi:hypothetical protein